MQNPRSAHLNYFRIGSEYDIETFVDQLNEALWQNSSTSADIYSAQLSKTNAARGYHRLVISGERHFRGKRALVFDIRLGPETASGEPSVFIRSRAPEASASEYVIGNKVIPGQEQGTGRYQLVGSAESLADIARGAFESTREARSKDRYQRDPLPIDELFALFTNRDVPRYERIRKRFNIPTGYQLSWGVPTPGEQTQQALYTPVIMASNRAQEEIESIYNEIVAKPTDAGLGALKKKGWFMAERDEEGQFGLKRIARTAYGEEGGQLYAQVYRGGAQEGHRPEDIVQALLKHIKSTTTWFASRSPQAIPLEWTRQEGGRRILQPRTAASYEDLVESPTLKPGYSTPQRKQSAATFGEMLMSGDYSRYVELSLPLAEEQRGQRAALALGLITNVPFQSGGALLDPRELKGTAGYGFFSGQAIDLPWQTAFEMSPSERKRMGQEPLSEILKLGKDVVGRRIKAGAQSYAIGNIAIGDKKVPITLEGKQYERQIQGLTMVLPPFRGSETGKFYTAEEQASTAGEKLISTKPLADALAEEFGYGIKIEASGTTDVPYMYIDTMGRISKSPKGLFATKAGDIPVAGLSATMKEGPMAGKPIKLGMVTQEVKQPLEAFAGAFAIQPHVNKLKMLEMIDPRLAQWYDETQTTYKERIQEHDQPQLTLEGLGEKYAELKGDQGKSHYLFLMGEMYDKFMKASEEENMANMKRYGIFFLQGDAEITGGIFHKSAIDAMRKSMAQLNKKEGTKRTLEDIGIRVEETDQKDYYNLYFTAQEGKSMVAPLLSGLSIEWPGQGKEINKDIVLSIVSNFPEFAKAKGITPGPQDVTGMSKERRAWLGIMGSYAYNEAASKGTVWKPKDESFYKTIDEEQARELQTELSVMRGDLRSGKITEEKMMGELTKRFGWQGLFFDKSGRFLPSPSAAEGIDEYQTIRNLGESRAHYITQYLGAFEELIDAEAMGGGQSYRFDKFTSFMGGRDSRIGRILSGDPEIVKKVYGNEIKGGGSGKYGTLNALKSGEMYMSKEEVYRIAESMGLKTGKQKAQLMAKIEAGDTKALFFRYPSLSKKLAILPVKLVAEKELQQRMGFSMKQFSALSPGLVWIDPNTQEPFIGDLDRDPAGWLLGLDVLKDKDGEPIEDEKGELTFIDTMAKDPNLVNFIADNRGFKWARTALEEVVGKQRADEYSQWMAPLAEYRESIIASADKLTGPLKARFEFGVATMKEMAMASSLYQNIMTRRGTTHIALNMFRQTASVLGVPNEMKAEAVKGIAALYQSSLEMSRNAGKFSPMEMLINTVMFGQESADPRSSVLTLTGATGLQRNKDEDTYGPAWQQFWRAGSPDQRKFMTSLVGDISQMEEFGPETLALAFASRKDLKSNYELIKNLLQGSPREEWKGILTRGGNDSLISKGNIDETSMMGTMFMTLAALRTHKLSGVSDERGMSLRGMTNIKIPYAGKQLTLEEFLATDEVKTLASTWQAATGKELGRPSSGILDATQLEQLAKTLPATARTGTGFTDILLKLGEFFGVGKTEEEIRGPGPLADQELINQLSFGPYWMRASSLSSIVTGVPEIAENLGLKVTQRNQGNYGPANIIKTASKWMGGLINDDTLKNIEALTKLSKQSQAAATKGEQYESAMVAYGTEIVDRVAGYHKLSSGYKVTSKGLTMIPHAMGTETPSLVAEFETSQAGAKLSKKLSGSADMIGLMTDPDSGEEYLHIQELKFGSTRKQTAGVQAVLYRDLLKGMADQDEAGLRDVLETWRKSAIDVYKEARAGLRTEGKLPGIAEEDWVDRAITAIKADRIRLSTASGMGHSGFIEGNVYPEYRVFGVDESISKLDAPTIMQAVSKYITGNLTTNIIKGIYDLMTTGSVRIPNGSDLGIGDNIGDINKMENLFNWFTQKKDDLRSILGTASAQIGGGISMTPRIDWAPDTGAGGGGDEEEQTAFQKRVSKLGVVRAEKAGKPIHFPGETTQERTEGKNVEETIQVKDSEELQGIGKNLIVPAGYVNEFRESLTAFRKTVDALDAFLGGGGEQGPPTGGVTAAAPAEGGAGDNRGHFRQAVGGTAPSERSTEYTAEQRAKAFKGLIAFSRLEGSPEVKQIVENAKILQERMKELGMKVYSPIDTKKPMGHQIQSAEIAFVQAATSGEPGVTDLARNLGTSLSGISDVRSAATQAANFLRGGNNMAIIEAAIEEAFPKSRRGRGTGSRVVGEGADARVVEGTYSKAAWTRIQNLRQMVSSLETPGILTSGTTEGMEMMMPLLMEGLGKGGGTRTGGGKSQQFTQAQTLEIYNKTTAAVQRLKDTLGEKVTPELIKFATEIEIGKVRLEELNKTTESMGMRRAEGDEGWAFTPTEGGGIEARRYERRHFGAKKPKQVLRGKAAEDMFAAVTEREAVTEQIKGAQEGMAEAPPAEGRAIRWGRLARGIFGGFGWMFLGRALGMGIRGITEGYEESQQFLASQEQAQMRYFGMQAAAPTAGAQFYARQRAMIAKGATGLGAALYGLETQMTGTMAGDIVTAGKTGLGFGLAGAFLGGELTLAGLEGLGAAVTVGGAAVGGITAGLVMPALMQYSYMQNRDATLSAVAAQRRRQQNPSLSNWSQWWAGVSANWQQLGIQNAEMAQAMPPMPVPEDYRTGAEYQAAKNAWYERRLNPPTPSNIQVQQTNRMVEQYLSGQLNVPQDQGQEMASRLLQTFITPGGLPQRLEGIPTEILSNVMLQQFAAAGGGPIGVSQMEKLAHLQLAGVPTEQMYGQAIQAGLMPSPQNMWQVQQLISGQPEVARQQQLGLQAMAGLTPSARLAIGIQPTAQGIMIPSAAMGELQMQPQYESITRAAEIQGWAEQRGLTLPQGGEGPRQVDVIRDYLERRQQMREELGPAGPSLFARNPNIRSIEDYLQLHVPMPELGNIPYGEEAATIFEERQRSRREGAQAVGWNEQQAQALLDMYQQAFEAPNAPQAMAMMPQAEQIMQQAVYYGQAPEQAMVAGLGMAQLGIQGQYGQMNILQGAMAGRPQAIAMMNLQQLQQQITSPMFRNRISPYAMAQQAATVEGVRMPVDITGTGQITGMGMYQSYIPPSEAAQMFGPGWQNRPVAAATQVGGINIGGRNFVGQWAIQAQQSQLGYEAQMAGIGAQQAQIALTREYYLGGPRFGRGLFAVQDAQRALGYEQTEWQFGRQRAQLAMQTQQFQENQALQWQGMQMQRQFAQAGWAFQDQVRNLQWGWRQEDFQENVRFMTGRQRRLAERQMGRETIMHGLEEENIQRQRDQQKEMWGLEDERFRLIQEHYKEQEQFQKEGIKAQEEFFKRRRALEEEMVEMQRTYMLENLKIQEQAIGAQAEYAKQAHENALDMISMQQTIAQATEDWQTAWNYTELAAEVFQTVYDWLVKIGDYVGADTTVGEPENTGPGGENPDTWQEPDPGEQGPRQHGGPVEPGRRYLVGERAPEIFIPRFAGQIVPMDRPSAWNNSYIPTSMQSQMAGGTQEITIYIGNDKLGTFVIDSVTKELQVG